ncbi:MAG: hypothetical protein ABSB80_09295 [Methanoregula sp.]|uniref:hypothetical protein n=1 Tax=Methanoregula sp. TaxID=2052170 RepID=UPI003D1123C4
MGYAAYSGDQFCDRLQAVPADPVSYHQERRDIATGSNIRWTIRNWPEASGTALTGRNCPV